MQFSILCFCDEIIVNTAIWLQVNPTNTQEALVAHCLERGVAVMAYSPFGFLVSRNKPNAPPPRADDPVLVEMAKKYNKTTSQIVLRYSVRVYPFI